MAMFNNNYLKGTFSPKHPEKCLNLNGRVRGHPITFRSSYEKIMANWLDLNNNILEWGSEITEIPYFSQIDGKSHRYITDFQFTCKTKDGELEKWLIEVKPSSQVPRLDECGQIIFPKLEPTARGKLNQKRIDRWQEYCNVLKKNHEKWTAARDWCRRNGFKFKVVTDVELGLTRK